MSVLTKRKRGELMRITAAAKVLMRRRILDASRELFDRVGFDAATTRDIAQAAKIATGTLFNYFPTNEAIEVALSRKTWKLHIRRSAKKARGESLEDDLFSLIALDFRQLKPLRRLLRLVLETALARWCSVPRARMVNAFTGSLARQT